MSQQCHFCSDLDDRIITEKIIPISFGQYKSGLVISLSYDNSDGSRIAASLWADSGEEFIEDASVPISYCPVCGRKL